MHTPATDTLRRARGLVAGGLSGATSIAAHGFAGGAAPSGASIAFLTVACAAFGVIVSQVRGNRPGVSTLLMTIVVGQGVGHIALTVGMNHGHHATLLSGLTPTMVGFHAATTIFDVALMLLVESTVISALGLLWRLASPTTGSIAPMRPLWAVLAQPAIADRGVVVAASGITRGPPR